MSRALTATLVLTLVPLTGFGLEKYRRTAQMESSVRECEQGSRSEVCMEAAVRHREGMLFVLPDPDTAFRLFLRACELGDGGGCSDAGYLLAFGTAGEGGVPEGVKWYARGCELGSALACSNLAAVVFHGGWGVEADPPRAVRAWRKACELRDRPACAMLRDPSVAAVAAQMPP